MKTPEGPEPQAPVFSQQGVDLLEKMTTAIDTFNARAERVVHELSELKVNIATMSGDIRANKEATDRNSAKLDDLAKEFNRINASQAELAVKANFNIITAIGAILAIVGAGFAITNTINGMISRRDVSPSPVQVQRAPVAPAVQAKP